MLSAALVAFAHFLAFFALTAAVVVKLSLVSDALTVETAKRIRRADQAAGMSAVAVLVFGFLRVFYFEKGSDYYFDNTFFWLKLSLFFAAALASIYPTLQFASWRQALADNRAPEVSTETAARIKKILHWELIALAGVMLCASLMAKGYGM